MSIDQWSSTAANNASGVTGISWAEGQAPSTVNDSAREMMAQIAIWRDTLFTTGDVKLTFKTTADSGWVLMNDGSIGSASSGATTRANADTVTLYTLLWNNTANAECPVATGRGANAAADFSANKAMTLPLALGRALACYGSGSGLTARALGKTTGVETVALSTAELASHSHTAGTLAGDSGGAHTHTVTGAAGDSNVYDGGGSLGFSGGSGTPLATATAASNGAHTHTVSGSTASAGSGTAHQNMQPTLFLNVMIKL